MGRAATNARVAGRPATGVGLRVHALVVLGLLACLAGVVGFTVSALSRQHARLLDLAAAERTSQLADAVARVGEDFDDIAGDLSFFAGLVEQAEDDEAARRSLSALLGSVRIYRAAEVWAPGCVPRLVVRDPRWSWGPDPPALVAALDETAGRACREQVGDVVVSHPLDQGDLKWFRVFARAAPSGSSVALIVDTAPLLDRLRTLTADASAELLVLGPFGGTAPVTASRPAQGLASGASPTLGRVAEEMRAGESGTAVLPRSEATALGYPDADLIVVYRPIPVTDAVPGWSAAVLVSAEHLEAHERTLAIGLLASAGAGTAVLTLLAAYVVRVGRAEAAAAERLRSAEEVAHLRERAERILDHVPAGVVALGRDGVVTAVNVTLRRWSGTDAASLGALFARAAPAAVAELEALVTTAERTGQVQGLTAERIPLFGHDGTYTVHAVPIEPATPEVSVLLVVDDLTELRTLQDQLLRTEKLATVGVLAAGIAHEVGTPLGVIRGRAELVGRKLGADHPQAPSLTVIVEQIDRIARTIRALLDFATPRPTMAAEVDLQVPVDRVCDLVRYEADKRRVHLETGIPPEVPRVRADGDQVQQVLVNLVMNALDATAPGGHVRIEAERAVDATSGRRSAVLRVRDDGCGIPPEHLHRIFDPFFTTKKRGHGTGLGLAIVDQIARDHGGGVRVDSQPGRGTVVEVSFPPREVSMGERPRVLVVDDVEEMTLLLAEELADSGYDVITASDGADALARARDAQPDAAVTDLRMSPVDGFDVLAGLRALDPELPVIVMTAFGTIDTAVEAMRRGAYTYVTKPFPMDELTVQLEKALAGRAVRRENRSLRRLVNASGPEGMVGSSPAMRTVYDRIARLADADVPVLIRGASGTGKERVARALHEGGARKARPFVAVNCASVPATLLESELFGHVKGSFTGATGARRGLFLEADGGTLFLDEIGDMPLELQAHLLRVLEDRVVRAVGADTGRTVDVRVVAATHQSLEENADAGTFRRDLLFRLDVVPLILPPLRDRVEDLPELFALFASRTGGRVGGLTPDALAALEQYGWPGNVRELENLVKRLGVLLDHPLVTLDDLRAHAPAVLRADASGPLDRARRELPTLRQLQQDYIQWVVDHCEGNKTRAAEILGIDVSTIDRRGRSPG